MGPVPNWGSSNSRPEVSITPTAVVEADGGTPATRCWPRRCPTPRHHGVPGGGHISCALAPDRVVHPCCPSISGSCVVMVRQQTGREHVAPLGCAQPPSQRRVLGVATVSCTA